MPTNKCPQHVFRNKTVTLLPFQSTDELFSVEPLAPPTNRANAGGIAQIANTTASVHLGVDPLDSERSSSGFISRINIRLGDIEDNNDADALVQDDGETSEQEDMAEREQPPPRRSSSLRPVASAASMNAEDESQDLLRSEENAQGESDNEFNFHEPETDSDSDDNQSTQDAQRSVQTGATAGSDTGEDLVVYLLSSACC